MQLDVRTRVMTFLRERPTSAAFLSGVTATLLVAVDWYTSVQLDIAPLYVVPLVLAGIARNRRLLWTLVVAFIVITFDVYSAQIPTAAFSPSEPFFLNRVLDAFTLLVVALLLHLWVRAVDALAAQSRSLAEQNRELDRMRQLAFEASAQKTQLLATVSHDIGTPLSVIDVVAGLILRKANEPDVALNIRDLVDRLRRNTRSVSTLRSALIDIAALDAGRVPYTPTLFSLNDCFEEMRQQLLPLAEDKRLQLLIDAPNPPVRVSIDRTHLLRVLTNLVTNAIKYTDAGHVALGASVSPDGELLIRVSDSGIGMSPEDVDRIFDEYGQLGNPQRDHHHEGWGLGLAICRRLVAGMGGTLSVASEPDRGSTFTVRLPASCLAHPVHTSGASMSGWRGHQAPQNETLASQ
jgi:signal transduction histidine kinase